MGEKKINPRRYRWIREEMYILRKREASLPKERVAPPKDIGNVQTWRYIITTG